MPIRLLLAALVLAPSLLSAQGGRAVVREEIRIIETYPFSDPNPVPILTRDARLYPYHLFDGYSHTSTPREWKVITLENEGIAVYILPEVGGKIWGAVDKTTGFEFIYRNEVLKFRNIALRGPWTSGGVEFNFGIIGHTPAGATPVDYTFGSSEDGGVFCTVGALDLPSRTRWRVTVTLSPDRACFETEAAWDNPGPFMHAAYTWMNAAAPARDDLRMFMPGDRYLEHGGRAHSWPVDTRGRDLSFYAENDFGDNKSYHVVGRERDFFGGYYSGLREGFGHWADYADMPGQKLWLWALSRAGGIWEDLLTDTDGQYIEWQAGRYLVQYAPGRDLTPIRQAAFAPCSGDRWKEVWFPVRETGGLSDASPFGVMFVSEESGSVTVRLNAFEKTAGTVFLEAGGDTVAQQDFSITPLEPAEAAFSRDVPGPYRITVPALALTYDSDEPGHGLARPFETPANALETMPASDRAMLEAEELLKARRYKEAEAILTGIVKEYPGHRKANTALADIRCRSGLYEKGLERITRVLEIDTYDPEANYTAGLLHRFSGDLVNARECQGWAARSPGFRTAAAVQLAEIALQRHDWPDAARWAAAALNSDTRCLPALEAAALAARKSGQKDEAVRLLERLLSLDPLHHWVRFERVLLDPSGTNPETFLTALRSEYPDQTLLELAISYANRGLRHDAVSLLRLERPGIVNPLLDLWLAFLIADDDPDGAAGLLDTAADMDPGFVFPFRRETIEVLQWALIEKPHWKFQYWLALNLWARTRDDEAARLLKHPEETPDYAPFYTCRAHLYRSPNQVNGLEDLKKALRISPDRRNYLALVDGYADSGDWENALTYSTAAYRRFGDDFNTALLHARSLIHTGSYREAVAVLQKTTVLPSENAALSHRLWEWAHLHCALDLIEENKYEAAVSVLNEGADWPEHLGQGRPYEPDRRLFDYLLGICHERSGRVREAAQFFTSVTACPGGESSGNSMYTALTYLALMHAGHEKKAAKLPASFTDGSPWSEWNRALIEADGAGMERLETTHPRLFSGIEFSILRRMLAL
ncbi:DUF5107 domain-containing protein [bacterium]|nr:DUF5107 domain-containing protein [bacterium]